MFLSEAEYGDKSLLSLCFPILKTMSLSRFRMLHFWSPTISFFLHRRKLAIVRACVRACVCVRERENSCLQLPANDRLTPFALMMYLKILGQAMAVAVQPTKEVETKKKPHTKQKRVVVTGLGVVSPLGHEPDVFYNNLLEGVSGVSQIEAFDCAQFSTVIDYFNTSFLHFVALNKSYLHKSHFSFFLFFFFTENCWRNQVYLD